MKSTTSINLNLQLPNYSVAVYAVQGDTMSREIEAALFDGVSPFVPEYGTLSVVRYKKPDGTCGFYDTDEDGNDAVTWEDNVATIRLAEQALTVAGTVLCQVQFYNGNEQRLSSFTWKIIVEENVCPDDDITSSDYFNILTQQIASIMEVVTDLPAPSTVLPEMDGTAAIGILGQFARADHVHPSDTSKADISSILNIAHTFNLSSTGTIRNAVLHTWCATLRQAMATGETAMLTGVFQSSSYSGFVLKATDSVMFGRLYAPNSKTGFYFRDASGDIEATSADYAPVTGITYVEDSVTVSFSAGTIGTRGYQTTFAAPTGKKLIGAVVTYLGDSTACVPSLLSSSGTLYLNVYRATSSSVSNVKIDVRFTFVDT